MAPRAPETFEQFTVRLQRALDQGHAEVRFGRHHFSHAVCIEERRYRIRRLETSAEDAAAFLETHGYYMPENAEELAKPGAIELDVSSLDELLSALQPRWQT